MIPVIINNRNRVTMLKFLIDWLLKLNDIYIVILDNNSTYGPLLDYYKEIKDTVKIKYLKDNLGSTALYKVREQYNHKSNFFIYTDPDLLPIPECPLDVIEYYKEIMLHYPQFNKIGFGLKIDDLPDCYAFKKEVINWENQWWSQPFNKKFFYAQIGITFALYHKSRPAGKHHDYNHCLRSKYPYLMRHLPWYIDNSNLDEEEVFYVKNATALEDSGRPSASWSRRTGFFPKIFL